MAVVVVGVLLGFPSEERAIGDVSVPAKGESMSASSGSSMRSPLMFVARISSPS